MIDDASSAVNGESAASPRKDEGNPSAYGLTLGGRRKRSRWIQKLQLKTLTDIQNLVDEIHDEFGHGCLIF